MTTEGLDKLGESASRWRGFVKEISGQSQDSVAVDFHISSLYIDYSEDCADVWNCHSVGAPTP